MAVSITPNFVSLKEDNPEALADGQITPSRYNAGSGMTLSSGYLLGRLSVGEGAVEELTPGQVTTWLNLTTSAVTSVGLSVPTGLQVANNPITTSGTLAVTYASGYQGYTTTEASKLAGLNSANYATAAQGTAADAALSRAGGTMTGLLTTLASTTGTAGFNLPHGTAPTTPVNGDMWSTTTSLTIRLNGQNRGVYHSGNTVPVANGGTGRTTLTANTILGGNGTGTVNMIVPGASGTVLTSDGTTASFQAAPGGAYATATPITITAGTTNLDFTAIGAEDVLVIFDNVVTSTSSTVSISLSVDNTNWVSWGVINGASANANGHVQITGLKTGFPALTALIQNGTGNAASSSAFFGRSAAGAAVVGLRFTRASGTWTSGVLRLFRRG